MNFKHVDISLCAGDIELVAIPGEYLDTLDFPFIYEDISLIQIYFGDSHLNEDIRIEIKLINNVTIDFLLNGNGICYQRLFEFVNESTERITQAYFRNFQLTDITFYQHLYGNYVRKTPYKPVIQSFDNGSLMFLKFMAIDHNYRNVDYTDLVQWKKPASIYLNENGEVNNLLSYISFIDSSYKNHAFNLADYTEILFKLINKIIVFNVDIYEFEIENDMLTVLDECMIDIYFFFNDYQRENKIMLDNRDELFTLNDDEKTLLHMQVI